MPDFGERLLWYGLTLIGLGGAALLTPQISGYQRALGWFFIVLGMCVILYLESSGILSFLHGSYARFGVPYPKISLIVVMVLGAVLAGGGWWFLFKLEPSPTTLATSPTSTATPHLASLKDLFENDWPDVPAYYNVSVLQVGEGTQHREINLAWRLNADFQARAQFLAFLLDSKLSPIDAVDVCVFLADHYQQFIDIANSQVDIAGKWPTDTSTTHLKDLVFSKRIFIYYENPDLSVTQMGSLEVLYQQKGLSIQFRGTDYQWLHRNDHPPLRPESPKPGVLLPRALGTGFIISITKLSL